MLKKIFFIYCLLLLLSSNVKANSVYTLHNLQSEIKRGKLLFSLYQSLKISDDYFDGQGNLKRSRNGSTVGDFAQDYLRLTTNLTTVYGINNWLSLGLNLPLLYRSERQTLNAYDVGLGDIELYSSLAIQRFASDNWPLLLDVAVKFPSGDRDFSAENINKGVDLPLGTGQIDLQFGLRLKLNYWQHLLSQAIYYKFRFSGLVEYLQPTINPDLGNLQVDFANQLLYQLFYQFSFKKYLQPFLALSFSYFGKGSKQQVTTDSNGDLFLSTATLNSGYLLQLRPGFSWPLTKQLTLFSEVSFPLLGNDRPQLPLVEDLIGIEYLWGISFATNY